MSALARFFRHWGHVVAGDRTPSPPTHTLERRASIAQYVEDPEPCPLTSAGGRHDVLLVRTPAVPLDSPLLHH